MVNPGEPPDTTAPAQNVRYCAACNIDVDLKCGGNLNWTRHIASPSHLKAAGSAKLNSFFTKKPKESKQSLNSPQPPSNVRGKVHTVVDMTENDGASETDVVGEDDQTEMGKYMESGEKDDSMRMEVEMKLQQLKALAENLPLSVSLTQPDDLLYQFLEDPGAGLINEIDGPCYDLWESSLNGMLHSVFWGKNDHQLTESVRRGPGGVLALVEWIRKCVDRLKLLIKQFEPHIDRMSTALSIL